MGAPGRHQGPQAQLRPGARQEVLLQQGLGRPRRHDRARGGLHADLDRRRRVPRLPSAALGVRGLDAARRGRGLPQGRRPDRGDGRHLPRRRRRRGRRRVRRPDLLAAARRRSARQGHLLRAARGVRRRRATQRRPVPRRPGRLQPPRLVAAARRPGRGAAGLGGAVRPGHPRHARPLGVPRRGRRRTATRRDRVRVRRDHDPAVEVHRDRARARRVHRAARLGVAGARLARGGPRGPPGALDDRPHRLPGDGAPDGARAEPAAQAPPPGTRRVRPRLHRPAPRGRRRPGGTAHERLNRPRRERDPPPGGRCHG
ncbi:hypothetical protein NOCARDAX2BIS_230198 [Nocardioides sp. AX2bis]|nr:hypothetical protein NOCARDAX2BIS_230198 [Nocardioides sp. AX2bis]